MAQVLGGGVGVGGHEDRGMSEALGRYVVTLGEDRVLLSWLCFHLQMQSTGGRAGEGIRGAAKSGNGEWSSHCRTSS